MHKQKQTIVSGAVLLTLLCGGFCNTALARSTPPDTLTLRDLAGHPERWPEAITIQTDMQFGDGTKITKGQTLPMIDLQGSDVIVDPGNHAMISVDPKDCDLVDAANKFWATLTPAQRAVDAQSLAADASLWPDKVKCSVEFDFKDGTVMPPGTEYQFGVPQPNGDITLINTKPAGTLKATIGQTDALHRAQKLAAIDPDKRPSRLVEALKGKRVDADGKALDDAKLDDTKIFAFYYGASWCPPCRKFSPDLVKFANAALADNPHLTIVMLNMDDEPAKMLEYLNEEKFPFAAVPKTSVLSTGPLAGYACNMIPQLVITDRYGKELADTFTHGQYTDPELTLAQWKKILASGAAK